MPSWRWSSGSKRSKSRLEAGAPRELVIKDEDASVTLYTQIGGDEDRMHKKLHILDARGPREIAELSSIIEGLAVKRRFVRYYFANETDRDRARKLGGRGKTGS